MTRVEHRAGHLFINEREYVFVRDAVKETGLSATYIARLANAGRIPSCKIGNVWLVDRVAVRALAQRRDAGLDHATFDGLKQYGLRGRARRKRCIHCVENNRCKSSDSVGRFRPATTRLASLKTPVHIRTACKHL
jgi:hypothetical protein